MSMLRRSTCSLIAVVTILGCGSSPSVGEAPPGELAQRFSSVATEADVPRDLLVAVAAVEGGLAMPKWRGDLDVDNEVPAAGPLMLRHGKFDSLARGAALVGRTELSLRRDADLALHAGALVLSELASSARADRHARDLASWQSVLETLSGYADAPHRASYARRVFAQLARGGSFEGRDGERIDLPAHDVPPSLFVELDTSVRPLAAAQYPGAEFFPTDCDGKCTTTRGGNKITTIVVHDTEGGWDASVATLQNDPGKSCHYIIDVDGKVGQFVEESVTAWHAGNFYYNQRSIGIEHVGYSTKPYPQAQYTASVGLVTHLAKKYKVAIDRSHVIGHDQIPDGDVIAQSSAPCALSPRQCRESKKYGGASNHSDPGVWEWSTYMERLGGKAKCNDATAIWNCSSDKTRAFRCANDVVEVATCDGACEVQPNGTDDVCRPKPPDATGSAPEDPENPDAAATADGGSSAPPRDEIPASSPMQADDEGGCALANAGRASRSATMGSLGLAMAVVMVLRRRRVAPLA